MACARNTYGTLFYMVTDNFKHIPVGDSEDFKNASFRALEILLNTKGPYTRWEENRIFEILDDFCMTVGQHWEKSYKDRQTLLKSYRVYFGQDIIFKKDSRRPNKKRRSLTRNEGRSELKKTTQMVLDEESGGKISYSFTSLGKIKNLQNSENDFIPNVHQCKNK